MTHREKVLSIIRDHGSLSDHGIYHVSKAIQADMTPSSVRTRRSELEREGLVTVSGTEPTGRGRTAKKYSITTKGYYHSLVAGR